MSYWVNEVFVSLQGEGHRAGTRNVFVRFSGCNLRCRREQAEDSPGGWDCDTEFVSGTAYGRLPLVRLISETWGPMMEGRAVIFTGGEPSLQLDRDLVQYVKDAGFFTAIETNGTNDVSGLGLDWITVSPKTAEHTLRQLEANEVKYVRVHGQGIPRPVVKAEHLLLSPGFGPDGVSQEDLRWCMDLVAANPRWRLSVQQHKAWRVR